MIDPRSLRPTLRFVARLLLVALLMAALPGTPLLAQDPAAPPDEGTSSALQMTYPLLENLARLNDTWLSWNAAFLQSNQKRAEVAAQDMVLVVGDLGMEKLPGLASAMLGRALDAAREGDYSRALWAADQAELVIPSHPEVSLARGRIALLSKDYLEAPIQYAIALYRVVLDSLNRRVLLHNLLLHFLVALILAGAAFVALQFATKGGRLYRDIARRIHRFLPMPLAYLLGLALIVWPFALPKAWIWVVLYWSVLLWRYCEVWERVVITATMVLLALAPVVTLQLDRSVAVAMSEHLRAVDALEEKKFYGKLLADLGHLRQTLPESAAVSHVVADTHLALGQDQIARPLYQELIDKEPENSRAINNLGLYHFVRNEHPRALEYFQEAQMLDPEWMVPAYNLSQTYRELLEFASADRYLETARELGPDQVALWVNKSLPAQPGFGGVARRNEIRNELEAVWLARDQEGTLLERLIQTGRSAPIALSVPLLGMLFGRWLGAGGAAKTIVGTSIIDRFFRFLIPGLTSAEEEDGLRSFLALMFPIYLVTVPMISLIGYRMPLGVEPGAIVLWAVSLGFIAIYYLFRLPILFR